MKLFLTLFNRLSFDVNAHRKDGNVTIGYMFEASIDLACSASGVDKTNCVKTFPMNEGCHPTNNWTANQCDSEVLGLSGTGRWWWCSRVVYVHVWGVTLWRWLYIQIIEHTTAAGCGDSHPGMFWYVRHKRLNWCGRDLGGAFMLGTSAFRSQCKAQPITMTHIFNVLASASHVIPSHRIGWGVDNARPDISAWRQDVQSQQETNCWGYSGWREYWPCQVGCSSVDYVIRNGEAIITRWPQRAQDHPSPTFEPYALPRQSTSLYIPYTKSLPVHTQIARFVWPTWGQPGSCWPQVGPMLAPWTLLSGHLYTKISVCQPTMGMRNPTPAGRR